MSLIRQLYYLSSVQLEQWKKYSVLIKLQNTKLRKIINYAYHNVPFYKKHLKKANIHPSDIKDVRDLNKIPLISKEDIRNNFPNNIISKKIDSSKCWIWDTSGSTGMPLKIVFDKKSDDFANAIIIRSYIGNGLRFFDRWCIVGFPEYYEHHSKYFGSPWKIPYFHPEYISVFSSIEEKINLLKKYNPRILDCCTTDLFLIAKYIKENDVKGINPEVITSNGEFLDDYTRKYISEIFGKKISDVCGCFELRRTVWECPFHEGYHIDIDSVVMQFIKDGEEVAAGEEGRIVYTGLHNYAMPIIRYDIGDWGIPLKELCSCGRGLPLMKLIEGKLMDFLVTNDGELVSPHIAKRILTHLPGIKIFKIIQSSKKNIQILIVKNSNYKDKYNIDIRNRFKELLGSDIKVDLKPLDEIKRDIRKYKVIESYYSK